MKIIILSAGVALAIFLVVEILILNRKMHMITKLLGNIYHFHDYEYNNLSKQLDYMNSTLRSIESKADDIDRNISNIDHNISGIRYNLQSTSASVGRLYDAITKNNERIVAVYDYVTTMDDTVISTIRDEYDILKRIDKRISNESNDATEET